MVNNYVKTRSDAPGKRKKSIIGSIWGYLTAICLLKQVLSVGETGAPLEKRDGALQYRDFLRKVSEDFGYRFFLKLRR